MSLRKTARAIRDLLRDIKNSLHINTSFLAAKRRGDILKRIEDFDLLMHNARNASILDVGCYDGLIAYEFFRSGARLIHGLDNDAYHLETARRIFSQVDIPARFTHADLRKRSAVNKALKDDVLDQYDMVLFLGVFQHIYRAMSEDERRALICDLADKAAKIIAIRIPEHTWAEFEKYFPVVQFEEIKKIEQRGNVGELRIYQRRS